MIDLLRGRFGMQVLRSLPLCCALALLAACAAEKAEPVSVPATPAPIVEEAAPPSIPVENLDEALPPQPSIEDSPFPSTPEPTPPLGTGSPPPGIPGSGAPVGMPPGTPEPPPEPKPAASSGTTEVRNLVAEGNVEYRQLQFAKAIEKYDAAIRQDARYAIAHNNRGLALHKLGRLDDAAAAIVAARDLDDKKAAFWLNLGKVYAAAGKDQEALDALQKALELQPTLAAAAYNRLWILVQTEKWDDAAQAAGALAQMPSPPPGSQMLRGIVAMRQGQPQLLTEASAQPKELPQLWRWLGDLNASLATGGAAALSPDAKASLKKAMAAFSAEQFNVARQHLADAAAQSPDSPIPPWLTAMVCLAEGKNDEANAEMAKAEALMPVFRVDASEEGALLVYVDGKCQGRPPLSLQFLPGAHQITVIRRNGQGYSVFNQTGVFVAGRRYSFPSVAFSPPVPLDQLKLPEKLRSDIRTEFTRTRK